MSMLEVYIDTMSRSPNHKSESLQYFLPLTTHSGNSESTNILDIHQSQLQYTRGSIVIPEAYCECAFVCILCTT